MATAWSRRRLLTAAGGAAVSVPLGTLLAACSEKAPAAAPPTPPPPGPLTGSQELGQTGLVLTSQRELPAPYTRPLPVPVPIAPVRSAGTTDYYELVATEAEAEILEGVRTPIWGYDGTFPGPLFDTRRGRTAVVRLRNELPTPVVRHLHGALTPAPSDGYPLDLLLPVGGWEHLRHSSMSRRMLQDGRLHEGEREYHYPLDQRAGTLWYHDHRMDFTGPQVWRGLVGMHLHRDEEEDALGLPDGDHELPLLITDRSFGPSGELLYPSIDPELEHVPGVLGAFSNGVLGDAILVNGVHAPFHEVRQGTYRLRLLTASNARHWRLSVDPLPPVGEPFVQIGTDGGLMAEPMVVRSILMAPAERVDVVVDFSSYAVGDVVTLTNLSGSGPTAEVMQFRVVGPDDREPWRPPRQLSDVPRLDPATAVRTRRFTFSRVPVRGGAEFHIGHESFDPRHVAADPQQGDVEIWEFTSDITHPVHVHNTHFQVLGEGGPAAWKDVVSLSANDTARVVVRFDSYRGRYIMHCHNLEHEDMGMMANYVIR